MKRILVTGSEGFIGTHLCKRLRDDGHDVTPLDLPEDVKNHIPVRFNPGYEEIYNLACFASPKRYQSIPVDTTLTNVLGANRVLAHAHMTGAKVLQASTSEVYGDPLQHPQTEDYWGNVNPIGPRSCYDEGKRCAESLFFDYHRQYGTRIKVARIFNTYGPGMAVDDGRVVSNFIVQALLDGHLEVYGSGQQTRSLCYIDDMVEGLIRLMATGDEVTGPVNLGNPNEMSVVALAQKVKKLVGLGLIVSRRLPIDDPKKRCPDISKARELLDWEPVVNIDEGLIRTIDYFRTQLANAA